MKQTIKLITAFLILNATLTINVSAQNYYQFELNRGEYKRSLKWIPEPTNIIKIDKKDNYIYVYNMHNIKVDEYRIKDYGVKIQNKNGSTTAIWAVVEQGVVPIQYNIKFTFYKDSIIKEITSVGDNHFYDICKLVRTNK